MVGERSHQAPGACMCVGSNATKQKPKKEKKNINKMFGSVMRSQTYFWNPNSVLYHVWSSPKLIL